MIPFLKEGLDELAETAISIKLGVQTYLQNHFPSNQPGKQIALFTMLAYAALIITLPKVLSLLIAFPVVVLTPLILGAFVFTQASLESAIFWGRRIKRLENRLPNCYATLQENSLLLLALAIFSWLPFPGFQLRALMLLPLLTTELFFITKVIRNCLDTKLPELMRTPVTRSCAILAPVVAYSGVQATTEFFGLTTSEASPQST